MLQILYSTSLSFKHFHLQSQEHCRLAIDWTTTGSLTFEFAVQKMLRKSLKRTTKTNPTLNPDQTASVKNMNYQSLVQ